MNRHSRKLLSLSTLLLVGLVLLVAGCDEEDDDQQAAVAYYLATQSGSESQATDLAITSLQPTGQTGTPVSGGGNGTVAPGATAPVVAGDSYDVTVERRDSSGNPVASDPAITVTLSATGISGTTTGTIPRGKSRVTISGVTFSQSTTVSLKATSSGLQSTPRTVDVLPTTTSLWGSFEWGNDNWKN